MAATTKGVLLHEMMLTQPASDVRLVSALDKSIPIDEVILEGVTESLTEAVWDKSPKIQALMKRSETVPAGFHYLAYKASAQKVAKEIAKREKTDSFSVLEKISSLPQEDYVPYIASKLSIMIKQLLKNISMKKQLKVMKKQVTAPEKRL